MSASAFGSTPALTTPAKLVPEAATAMKLQSDPQHSKLNASFRPLLPQGAAQEPLGRQSDDADSGWRYMSTLLSTLALIVAIAIRRHLARKR